MPKKSASGFECGHCGHPEQAVDSMKVCARCRRVRYCDKACQSAHWKRGGHKAFCIEPEACKPSNQPQEDRTAAVVCIICRGTSGRTYMHACRARMHLSCLADLFDHVKDQAAPPCPICRAPLPLTHQIFDQLADQGHFQECKELSALRKGPEQSERDIWILFREAHFHEYMGHWAQAAELFRTILESGASLSSRKSESVRASMNAAEKMRDKPKEPICLARRAFFRSRFEHRHAYINMRK